MFYKQVFNFPFKTFKECILLKTASVRHERFLIVDVSNTSEVGMGGGRGCRAQPLTGSAAALRPPPVGGETLNELFSLWAPQFPHL